MDMFDVMNIAQSSAGLLFIALIVFAESGMMVGFFFPGDTLLFSAGIVASQGTLPLGLTLAVITFAAILGDNIGYHIGHKMGRRLFKEDSLVFRHEYIMRAEKFYEKHGTKTMLVAHFVPIVRTFAPLVAGVARMNRLQFFIYDAIGVIAWTFSIVLLGYFLGSRVPGIEHYIEPVLIFIILLFLTPTLYHVIKDPKIRQAIKQRLPRKKAKPQTDQTQHTDSKNA